MRKHRLHRLKTPITQIFLLFSIFYFLSSICYAAPISSTELIEKAKEHNNKIVEYQGEAVGDVMVRGNFAWVNLNDGKTAIGIWVKKGDIVSLVKYKGDYNYRGDVLLIKGIFHRACPGHGGDLDIHADSIIKLKEGTLIPHPIKLTKILNAASLFIIAAGLAILCAFKAKRKS